MKKLLLSIVAILLAFNALAQDVWNGDASPWTNGNGTQNDPYLIETASNLAYLAQKVNEGYESSGMLVFDGVYFVQVDDFDLGNQNWTPIGSVDASLNGFVFAGCYDGGFHQISNMRINSSMPAVGLFGAMSGNAVIKHLVVNQANIVTTGMGAGGIVGGMAGDATLYQCGFSGTITVNNNGTYCGAGGVVGVAGQNALINQCYFEGSVNVTNNGGFTAAAAAGGICAFAQNETRISSCYNTGNVSANAMFLGVAGGILAATVNEANVLMESCYNVGPLNAMNKGGVFGMISPINPRAENSINVNNCFYLNTVASPNNYGMAKNSDDMKTEEFINQLNMSSRVFTMDKGSNNGYPILILMDAVLLEASEITYNSAMLSAYIHSGNDSLSRACFVCCKAEDDEIVEIDVATDGFVEVLLENLEEETNYYYGLRLYFDDQQFCEFYPYVFTTMIDDVDEFNSKILSVYPNPASDFLNIDCDKPVDIQIFSLDGKMVLSEDNVNVVDVRGLKEGAYLININGKSTMFVKR